MYRIFFKRFTVCLLLFLMSCTAKKQLTNTAITNATTSVIAEQKHDELIDTFINDSIFSNAQMGICVYDPATNSYLHNYQSNKYFVPASNAKIATCYAAMKYLGDSLLGLMYLEEDSAISIQGTGDPTFLHKNFSKHPAFEWLKNVKKNIYVINNSNNKFKAKTLGNGWAWDDFAEPYMAERSAFPMYGNVVKFYHNKQQYKTFPHYFEKFFDKQFEASDGNTKFDVTRNYGENSFFFNIIPGKKDTATISYNTNTEINPTHLLLADTLKKEVRTIGYKMVNKKIYSQPTDSLLKQMMHKSDNFFAEQTLLMISLKELGFMSDEKIIDTLLKTDFKNLPQKPKWVDGSGLSRYNLFTPQDFVYILNKMKNEFNWQRIAHIFPTGNEGTLKGYYKKYQNKIFAKTGSLSNIFSLSGFVKTNNNKDLLFSVIINGSQATATETRAAVEKFITNIIEKE